MLVEERRQRVLDLVSKRGFVSLEDLRQVLHASESTIRRDLDYWHQQGVVRRTHGGPAPEETARAAAVARALLEEDQSWWTNTTDALTAAEQRLTDRAARL